MGKNRKKPRNKGEKNRRFGRWSNAALKPVNPGSGQKATPGITQVGAAEYRDRASSLGKPEAPLRHSRDEAAARARYMENELSLHHIRKIWRGPRHQGVEEYLRVAVYKEIQNYYRLTLLMHAGRYAWMLEDWRIQKKKFSISYGDRDRAIHAMECGWEEGKRFGITWKTELDLVSATAEPPQR
jgi:hypothetical protein